MREYEANQDKRALPGHSCTLGEQPPPPVTVNEREAQLVALLLLIVFCAQRPASPRRSRFHAQQVRRFPPHSVSICHFSLTFIVRCAVSQRGRGNFSTRRRKCLVSVSEVYFWNRSIVTVITMNTLWKVILSARLHNVENDCCWRGGEISYKIICFFLI